MSKSVTREEFEALSGRIDYLENVCRMLKDCVSPPEVKCETFEDWGERLNVLEKLVQDHAKAHLVTTPDTSPLDMPESRTVYCQFIQGGRFCGHPSLKTLPPNAPLAECVPVSCEWKVKNRGLLEQERAEREYARLQAELDDARARWEAQKRREAEQAKKLQELQRKTRLNWILWPYGQEGSIRPDRHGKEPIKVVGYDTPAEAPAPGFGALPCDAYQIGQMVEVFGVGKGEITGRPFPSLLDVQMEGGGCGWLLCNFSVLRPWPAPRAYDRNGAVLKVGDKWLSSTLLPCYTLTPAEIATGRRDDGTLLSEGFLWRRGE